MKLTENQIRRIVRKVIVESTRNPRNLELDLEELPIGGTLELESFGYGDVKPGKIVIKRVKDGTDEYSDEEFAMFKVKSGRNVLGPMSSYEASNIVGEFAY